MRGSALRTHTPLWTSGGGTFADIVAAKDELAERMEAFKVFLGEANSPGAVITRRVR
jgi:hypothetical protein